MYLFDLKKNYRLPGKKNEFLGKLLNQFFFTFTLLMFFLSVFDIGYAAEEHLESLYQNNLFRIIFVATGILYIIRSIFFTNSRSSWKVFISNSFLGGLIIFIFLLRLIAGYNIFFQPLFFNFTVFHFLAFILFILELSCLSLR